MIAQDTPCRRCAYNLRGLSADGRCPECGTSVARSLYGDALRYSDPTFVAKLRLGVAITLWSTLAAVPIELAAQVSALFALLVMANSLVSLAGAWLFTEPDPSGLGEERYGRARRLTRWSFVGITLVEIALEGARRSGLLSNVSPRLAGAQELALVGAGILAIIVSLLYFERLAERVSDRAMSLRLGDRARRIRGWLIVALVSFVIAEGARAAGAGRLILAALVPALIFALLTLVVLCVRFLMLTWSLRQALANEERHARASWSQPADD